MIVSTNGAIVGVPLGSELTLKYWEFDQRKHPAGFLGLLVLA